jgi:lysophospholipase L1-like esterase
MRRSRMLASVIGVVAATSAVLATANIANAVSTAGYNYVALGDSYSSGTGAGSYDINSSCERSSAAYPALYDAAASPSSFTFVACAGATASDIESNQLSSLSAGTTLVSLTDGGNDAGFSTVMTDCVLFWDSVCLSAISNAESYAQNTLPGVLDTLYSDIRADSPSAHVVVLGYPEFYDLANSSGCVGLDGTKRTAINGGADVIDGVIKTEVAKYANFTYKDVNSGFAGHRLCDSNPWLHSLTYPIGSSYHPTSDGQKAYLAAFEAGI